MRIALAYSCPRSLPWGCVGTSRSAARNSYLLRAPGRRGVDRRLQVIEPLRWTPAWPDAPRRLHRQARPLAPPGGRRGRPNVPGACAGLSIAMAPFTLLDNFLARGSSQSEGGGGRRAIFLVVPLFGALLVWSVYVLGSRFARRVGSPRRCWSRAARRFCSSSCSDE